MRCFAPRTCHIWNKFARFMKGGVLNVSTAIGNLSAHGGTGPQRCPAPRMGHRRNTVARTVEKSQCEQAFQVEISVLTVEGSQRCPAPRTGHL